MSVIDYFSAAVALDQNQRLIRDAEADVFALSDTTFSTPLAITDLQGVPMAKLRSSAEGIYPDFRVVGGAQQILAKSGDRVTPMTSLGVIAKAAEDAADAAATAASSATGAAEAALSARGEAVAAAEAAVAVGTTNDTVIAGRLADPTSESRAVLNASIDEAIASINVPTGLANSLVALGDSITAQSSSGAGTSDTASSGNYRWHATGYLGWAQTLLRHRFALLKNAGVSGQRSDQILARVQTDVVELNPAWCIVLAGTNDILQSISHATLIANLGAIYDALRAAGIRVVACTIPPVNSATTTAQREALYGANDFIRDYARTHPDVVVVDWHAAVADPATGAWITNASGDGVHPSAFGAFRMGQVMANALAPLVPPSLSLLGSNIDPFNKITNGRMQGAVSSGHASGITGDLATGWAVGWEGAAGTAVMSKVARTDDTAGVWQQIQLTSAGTFRIFQQANPLSAWGFAPGDAFYAEIEFQADADWSGVTRFGLDVEYFNGGSGIASTLFAPQDTWTGVNPRAGVLRTPVAVIPDTAARLQYFLRFFGSAGTVRFDRARLVKV